MSEMFPISMLSRWHSYNGNALTLDQVGGKSMGDFIFKEYDSWLEDPDDVQLCLPLVA